MQDFLNVEMTDEQIMDLLVEALQDITGFDEDITKETLLIDELGLDSLGFLDLFFTIQTSIQREVTNEQMRNLILEELDLDTDPNISKLSEGEKDRVAYPRLKVQNFFNIVKKQLNPELAGIDLEATSDKIFEPQQLESFLQANFEQIKQDKISEQIQANNITDPRMQEIVRNSFDAIDPSKMQSLFADKKLIANVVKKYLKDRMNLDDPENLQRFLLGENKNQLQIKAMLQSDDKGRSIFDMFLDQNKGKIFDLYLDGDEQDALKDTIIRKTLEDRKAEVINELSSNPDENLMMKIFDRRRKDIMDIMVERSKQQILDKALEIKRDLFESEFKKQKSVSDFNQFVWDNLVSITPEIMKGEMEIMEEEILSKGYQLLAGDSDNNNDLKVIFEEEKEALFADIIEREKSTIYKQMVLSDEEKENLMEQLVNDDKVGLFNQFISENKVSLKREVQQRGLLDENSDFATQLLADEGVQQDLMKTLIDSQIGSVFEEEVNRQSEMVDDTEVIAFLKNTFLTNEFRQNKIQSAIGMGNVQGDLVEEFMTNNFDRIAMEETQRLLADKELRNQLVQDYIKDNYDPMEAMQLNDPAKMKELQQKITEKYMQDNLDEIISRYMNDYMNEMMDAIPEEEIELDGDVQEEFMKKFMARMENEDEAEETPEANTIVERFIETYGLTDPMIQVFVENNFDDLFEIIKRVSGLKVDQEVIEQFVVTEFPLKIALYFHSIIGDLEFDHDVRQTYTKFFVENNMNEIMEITMQRQFEFMLGEEFDLDWRRYGQELNECVKDELRRMYRELDQKEVESQLDQLFKGLKYDWNLFLRVLKNDLTDQEREKILLYWLKDINDLEQIQIQYVRDFLNDKEDEIRSHPLGQWIDLLEGKKTAEGVTEQYEKAFRSHLINNFKQILEDFDPESSSKIDPQFKKAMTEQCIRIFLPTSISVVINSHVDELRDYITQFPLPPPRTVDDLLEHLLPEATKATYSDIRKRLATKFKSLAKKHEISQDLLTIFIYHFRKEYRKLVTELCELIITQYLKIGREHMIGLITNFSWEKQSSLIIGLLQNELSEEEILIASMSSFLKHNQRKMDKLTTDEIFSMFEGDKFFGFMEDMVQENIDNVLAKSEEVSFELEQNLSSKKFAQLKYITDFLQETQLNQINGFFGHLQNRLSLKPQMFLELAEEIASELIVNLKEEEVGLKDKLTVYAQRKVMEDYDFMIMERVAEKLEDQKFLEDLIFNIRDVYSKRNVFRLFRTGIRAVVLQTEAINWEQERSLIQKISHELLDTIISEMAQEIEV